MESSLSELLQVVERELNKEAKRPSDSYTKKELKEHFKVGYRRLTAILDTLEEKEQIKRIKIPIKDRIGRTQWIPGWIVSKENLKQ